MNEKQMPDWEKIALDLAEGIYQNGSWDNAQDLIDDRYGNDSDYLKPIPDALVEAVKRFVNEAEAVVDEDMMLCDYDISISSFKRLEAAYAAHKKAVT